MKVELKKNKKNFTMISNVVAKDVKISLKAKGMCLIIAHFPDNWNFYEEALKNYTIDGKTAISNALKELENSGYLHRKQLREKGRFGSKVWTFNDEGLCKDDLPDLTEIRKSDIGQIDSGKSSTINTHSNHTQEFNKKNPQKRKKAYYEFVNVLKSNAMEYSNLKIVFEDNTYSFANINGQLLLRDDRSDFVFSKNVASKLYQKMANSAKVQIIRGEK